MSRLRREIQTYMSEWRIEQDGSHSARFVFPPSFTGFRGHFPDRPVLPGICKIMTVLVMCATRHERPVHLAQVLAAKFTLPVGSDEELHITCRETGAGRETIRVKALVQRRGGESVARLDLLLRTARAENAP